MRNERKRSRSRSSASGDETAEQDVSPHLPADEMEVDTTLTVGSHNQPAEQDVSPLLPADDIMMVATTDHASCSAGRGSSSSDEAEERLSAADMVALATSLLAHPHWGPHLRENIQKIRLANVAMLNARVRREVLAARDLHSLADKYNAYQRARNMAAKALACRVFGGGSEVDEVALAVRAVCVHLGLHLADACVTGVALALLPLCHNAAAPELRGLNIQCENAQEELILASCCARLGPLRVVLSDPHAPEQIPLTVKCDDAHEEAVAAFYAALAYPTCTVQNLSVGGNAFGTRAAAAHLGRCLNVNSTVQWLRVAAPGLYDQAVWTAFSHSLHSNDTLPRLFLYDYETGNSSHVGATLAHSHKLSALKYVRVVLVDGEELTLGEMEGWGTMLKHNSTITEFEFRFSSRLPQGGGLLVPICEALVTNTTLQILIIGTGKAKMDRVEEVAKTDADVHSVAAMLRTNRRLQHLDIISSGIVCNAIVVDQGLSQNNTLRWLVISVDAGGAQALMTALCAPSTTTGASIGPHLHHLTLGYYGGVSACFPTARALGDMLASNQTLTELHLAQAPYSNHEWATTILLALATNRILKQLDLRKCAGVGGDQVYDSLLELLDSNTCITRIDLRDTPLDREGKAQVVNTMTKANKEYRAVLKNVPSVVTTSCRLVLCGYPLAGKTTLLHTMLGRQSSSSSNAHSAIEVINEEPIKRTRGIDIQRFTIDGLTMWMWDFAGQREFHPLQDFIFPNGASVHAANAFVFTFNPLQLSRQRDSSGASTTTTKKRGHYGSQLKTQQQFDREFSYWLKFICSNAIPRPSRAYKPLVLVVITHKDRLRSMGTVGQEAFRIAKFKEWMRDVAKKFEDKLVIENGNLFFVDATNKDDPHLGKFVQTAIRLLRQRINDVSKVPAICESVAKALGGCGEQQSEPIIPVTEFQSLCRSLAEGSTTDDGDQAEALRQLFEGDGNRASKVIAAYLRDAGEVLYIKDLPFLVRNPRWFAHGILGFLIDIFTPYYSSDGHQDFGLSEASGETSELPRADDLLRDTNGLVDKAFLAELLEHAIEIVELNPDGTSTDQLIMLMEELDLCYQTEEKYLIPALLQDEDGKAERGECKREWDLDLPSLTSKRIFVSRRLQCSDPLRTFITPGFFPRLQVVLQKEVHEWNVQEQTNCGKRLCDLEKYFCRLRCNSGMEVLVEHSGSYDYFLDIMVKSYESREDTEEFLQKIINRIRRFCASIKGCQGVTLVEGIIRPDCIGENIVLCRHRQSILVADLKERMATIPEYKCYWEQVEEGTMPLPAAMHDPQRLLDGVPQGADECYPDWNVKQGKKRGLAVIISMEKYGSGERSGGREDREHLIALAQNLQYEEHVMVDYTAAEVIRALKTIAQEKVLEEHESFVCFVNGHGDSTHGDSEEHYFQDQDDEMLFLDSIVRPFRQCKHLQDKAKVFFVNSCRGSNKLLVDDEEQSGTSEESGASEQSGTSEQQQPTSLQLPKEGTEYKYVREVKDCLIVFSASGRSVSTRYPQVGTSFVRALKKAFSTNRRQTLDVLGIVCCASHEVANEEHDWKKGGDVTIFGQCPVYVSSLTKLLYWR